MSFYPLLLLFIFFCLYALIRATYLLLLKSKAESWPGRKTHGDRRGIKPQNTAQLNAHTTHTSRQPFRQYQTLNTDSPPARHWPNHPMPQAWGCAVPFCRGRPPASESTGFLIGMEAKYWRNSGTTAIYVVGAGCAVDLESEQCPAQH